MADVFISFIHEEHLIAKAVQTCIERCLEGYLANGVFLSDDKWQVPAGEVWLNRIKKELEEAKAVILMLSSESVKRPWVNFEAGAAWLTNKAVIPVCFKGLTKKHLPKPYSDFEGVDIPNDLFYLVRSVNMHVNQSSFTPFPFSSDAYEYKVVEQALEGMDMIPPFDPPC